MESIANIEKRYNTLKPFMNELMKRLWSSTEAEVIGYGGIEIVSKVTGKSRTTISKGKKELSSGKILDVNRIRKAGGGRKKIESNLPNIEKELLELIEPTVRGEPESPLLWTTKSLRNLSEELKSRNYNVSYWTVRELLKKNKFSLQANRKTDEGKSHPDRDAQFHHIHNEVVEFQKENNPVISVDAKKKELVGNFKNAGKKWTSKGGAEKVKVYDFPSDADGKAITYGVYDMNKNDTWVNVGTDHDTAEFAVQTIRNWWNKMGKQIYGQSKKILITADGGGSNSSRARLWKSELQKLANEISMEIHVCHFPPGTSKWNKIEHRLFSYISKNWQAKPLISYEVVVNLIGSTKTKKGLKVNCELDLNKYEKGIKIKDDEFAKIGLIKNDFHGEWNYIIMPNNK